MSSDSAMNAESVDSTPADERPEDEREPQVSEPPEPAQEGTAATGVTAQSAASEGGFVAGAAAVVSAGLGLSSLIGTPLGEMLRARASITGQIESRVGGGNPVEALYTTPWHTAAIVNGIVALVAVLVGGVTLVASARRGDTRPWVKAVALGGVVLGAIGLLVAGGMYFDLFASQPRVPAGPRMGG